MQGIRRLFTSQPLLRGFIYTVPSFHRPRLNHNVTPLAFIPGITSRILQSPIKTQISRFHRARNISQSNRGAADGPGSREKPKLGRGTGRRCRCRPCTESSSTCQLYFMFICIYLMMQSHDRKKREKLMDEENGAMDAESEED